MGEAVQEDVAVVGVVGSAGDGVIEVTLDHAEDGLGLSALATAISPALFNDSSTDRDKPQ